MYLGVEGVNQHGATGRSAWCYRPVCVCESVRAHLAILGHRTRRQTHGIAFMFIVFRAQSGVDFFTNNNGLVWPLSANGYAVDTGRA